MSKTCVIFNPGARGDKARALLNRLGRVCGPVALKPTHAPGHARFLAAQAVSEGFGTVVAAGGDGTVNEVVNGLVDAANGLRKARLGLLPMGTVNVFAREIGIPLEWRDAWPIANGHREIEIDVPCAQFTSARGGEQRVFIQLAGAGWDARAVELLNLDLKKKFGPLAYILSGFQALGEPGAEILVKTPTDSARGQLVLIGNGRYYAGTYPFFHRANLSDGLLDICVFDRFDWSSLPGYTLKFLTNRLFQPGAYTYLQASRFSLSASTPTGLQLEGDFVGGLPARFHIHPEKLRVVVA